MNRLHKYLDNITRTLFYYDFQPLLFFWVLSDVFNNMVLWSTHSMWVEQGQGNTYFLYLAYLILSLSMLIFLNNNKKLANIVTLYLCLNLFSTIRYLVNIFSQEVIVFEVIDYKNLFITLWYSTMWFWIAFKLKRECFFNTLNENCPK
jgi:hypothetical protein|tara:strand:- start:113 stop:556 length:444 start_codon:yes stop_codon:yes gene_type:complete